MKTKSEKTSLQILKYFLSLKKHLEESNNIIDRSYNAKLQKKYRVPWNVMRIAKEIGLICNPKIKTWIFIYQPDIDCINKIIEIRAFLTLHPTIKISEIKNYPQCSFVFKPNSRRTRAFITFFKDEKIPCNRPIKDITRKFKRRKLTEQKELHFDGLDDMEDVSEEIQPTRNKTWIDTIEEDWAEVQHQKAKQIAQNESKRKSVEAEKEVYIVTTFMQSSPIVRDHIQVAGEKIYESWHNSHQEAVQAAKEAAVVHPNEVIFIMKCVHRFKTEVSVIEI